jgi:hypothetical protein
VGTAANDVVDGLLQVVGTVDGNEVGIAVGVIVSHDADIAAGAWIESLVVILISAESFVIVMSSPEDNEMIRTNFK